MNAVYLILFMNSNDIIIASGLGACCTLLLALRKGRSLSTVFGWALAGFGAGIYIGTHLAKALGYPEKAGAFAVSFSGLGWVKPLMENLPKYIAKKMGVATSDDAHIATDDYGGAALLERVSASDDQKPLG